MKSIPGKLRTLSPLLATVSALFLLTFAGPAKSQDIPPEVLAYPETILYNGNILTVDDQFSIAEALAIRGERILAVGNSDRLLKMAGPDTEKVDLQGKTAIPGMIDTHYHFGGYAIAHMLLKEKGIQWEGEIQWLGLYWDDVEMALRDVSRAVEAHRPGELVRISVYIRDRILPQMTMQQLDAASPQNPVVFVGMTNSGPMAANTKALDLAGIPSDTAGLPAQGGVIPQGRANQLLGDYLMWNLPEEQILPWHKQGMKMVNGWGLTTIITRMTPGEFNAIREIWLAGDLTLRWRVGFPGPLDIPHTGNVSDIGDDWLRISGAGGGTALPGRADAFGHWSTRIEGNITGTPEEATEYAAIMNRWNQLRERLLETFRYGWSAPNSHVLGDIAVRHMLDLIEEAQRTPVTKSSNQRYTLDHMVEVDPSDIARMARLGITPSNLLKDIFGDQVRGSEAHQRVFGTESMNRMLPIKTYLDAGIYPTLEADTGDAIAGKPLWTIGKAVCRCVDGSTRVWGRNQKISREDALRMKTIWAAAFVGEQDRLGSLEPGKLADLVILDGDYMTVPEPEISELNVVLTFVGGKKAYSLVR